MEPVRFGKYLLLDQIATGGMAQLYRAKMTGDEGFQKLIAIKKILPHLAVEKELVDSFIDEAKLAAFLQHENIIRIYDFGTMENDYFIAMEYLFGKNLRMVMDRAAIRKIEISPDHALFIIGRVCDGLDYSHSLTDLSGIPLKIIHRDISPPNIFISYDGTVKIVDFGVAKASSKNTTTQTGIIKGKLAYMSPEQAQGKEIDHRSDIFSVGILFYEMITGSRMFTGETMQVLAKVREADYVPAQIVKPDIDPMILDILQKALEPDPDQRYQSCGQMLADVDEAAFALNFRGSTRTLAHYMQELYSEQIEEEEKTKRFVLKNESCESPGCNAEEPREATTVKVAEKQDKDGTLFSDEEVVRDLRKKQGRARAKWAIIAVILMSIVGAAVYVLLGTGEDHWQPALLALEQQNYTEAVSLFDEAARLDPAKHPAHVPAHARALVEEARRHYNMKETGSAEAMLKKAVTLNPADIDARFLLGRIHLAKKDYKKAIDEFGTVTRINPGFVQAFFNLGYIYAVTGDYPKAESFYEKAARLTPPFLDEVLTNLAAVQDKMGKRQESLKNLEKAVSLNPQNSEAKEYLKWLKSQNPQA